VLALDIVLGVLQCDRAGKWKVGSASPLPSTESSSEQAPREKKEKLLSNKARVDESGEAMAAGVSSELLSDIISFQLRGTEWQRLREPHFSSAISKKLFLTMTAMIKDEQRRTLRTSNCLRS
jgi:hypothetical protein